MKPPTKKCPECKRVIPLDKTGSFFFHYIQGRDCDSSPEDKDECGHSRKKADGNSSKN